MVNGNNVRPRFRFIVGDESFRSSTSVKKTDIHSLCWAFTFFSLAPSTFKTQSAILLFIHLNTTQSRRRFVLLTCLLCENMCMYVMPAQVVDTSTLEAWIYASSMIQWRVRPQRIAANVWRNVAINKGPLVLGVHLSGRDLNVFSRSCVVFLQKIGRALHSSSVLLEFKRNSRIGHGRNRMLPPKHQSARQNLCLS